MSNFRPIDRETGFLLPPSVDEWLPERLLARFVVEVVGGLDLRSMTGSYRGSGEASYHPELLLGLIVYGYATGVFSSRKLERASYIRWHSASLPPTSIPITTRSPRVPAALPEADRDAVHAGAGRGPRDGCAEAGHGGAGWHQDPRQCQPSGALSYEHASKIEAQLQAEVADLLRKAEAADQADVPDGMSIPEELARREARSGGDCPRQGHDRGASEEAACAGTPREARLERRVPCFTV